MDESPSIRWRHSEPPGKSEAAVAALETLLERLAAQGWEVAQRGDETWYGYVLSGAADEAEQLHAVAALQERARAWVPEQHRPELREESREPEWMREPRVEPDQPRRAESERLDDGASPKARVSTAAPRPASRTRRTPAIFAVYGLAVGGGAAVFLVGFHSGYAAAVAALTAVALSLGVDSWLVARRQAMPSPHAQPPHSENP